MRQELFPSTHISPKVSKREDVLERTHCDCCKKKQSDGVLLSWFSSSTVVCNQQKCIDQMLASWKRHLAEMEVE